MSLGNGNPNSGNKGSNWRYEYNVLKALECIVTNTEASGGGCCPATNLLLTDIEDNQTNGTQQTQITDGTDTMLVNADGSINVNSTFTPSGTQDINIVQLIGVAPSATNPFPSRPTNGSAFLVNLGETAATGNFSRITDGTDTALVTGAGELNTIATAQPGVDIGDVTVNNAAGASAVNIQDGGNSITVDAVNLDIRDLVFATDKVDVSGSTITATAAGTQDTNLIQIAGTAVTSGAGVVTAGTQRTTLASDDPAVVSLAIMDDWDESDRAKVNPIVGSAGIAGGTGVDAANVTRVSLATNVPLPAGTNNIGDVDILSIIPGTGATNIGKAEDSPHTTGDVGIEMLAVRNDANADFSGTDLDYTPLAVSAKGVLKVSGDVADNAPQVNLSPSYSGGVAVDITTLPTFTAGDAAGLRVNKDTGALVVLQANLDNTQDTVSAMIKVTSNTSNTATRFRNLAVSTTGQTIKGSAGNLYGWNIVNLSATIIYVKFYNEVLGTSASTPIKTLLVPASGSVYQDPSSIQTSCSTGISVRAVTGTADADATSPSTSPIIEIEYA